MIATTVIAASTPPIEVAKASNFGGNAIFG
jgi:hypothetical protein